MSLDMIYEQMISQVTRPVTPRVNLFEKIDKIEKIQTEFKIKHVNIYIKHQDQPMPEIAYRGRVTMYEERGPVTVIDAQDGNKKLLIKIDKNGSTDVTIMDQQNNIVDEFVVNGMQLRDIDEPDKLSIIKVEEVE